MDTFELDADAFYICTEVSPRNFVVQKAIQIDKSQIERMVGKLDGKAAVEKISSPDSSVGTSSGHSPGTSPTTSASSANGFPQPPPLPYWFNRECKSTLMMIGPQPSGPLSVPTMPPSHQLVPATLSAPSLTRTEIKRQLKSQLEFYFSRENLITDKYLKCQMDADHYVPINVLAKFPKILRLTSDVSLIVEALKESAVVELDESCEKARAFTKRTTIIIRELPENYRDEVIRLLSGGPRFTDLKYGFNDSWYVTYENELDTQIAYVAVQTKKNEITQRPVCARIKAGGPPTATPPAEVTNGENGRSAALNNGEHGTIQFHELGQTLADYGFVPVATYCPGDPNLNHFEYNSRTLRITGGMAPSMSHLPTLQQPPLTHQQFYYSSSVSTTPRNYDEMSTASSNVSTRTTASNYNNRSGNRNNGGGSCGGDASQQYYESRRSFSNSNEWRGRGGGRFQSNQSENNQRQNNSRWSGSSRNGVVANGHQQDSWQNSQNQNRQQNGKGYHNSWNQNEHLSNSWWLVNDGQNHHRQNRNNNYNNRPNAPVSSSSSSSTSFSPDAAENVISSEPSTPPSLSGRSHSYNAPTPTDLPPPPVWPAPNFDRRRKSSETSITTNTTTNTLTPSTPVTPPVHRPAFLEGKAQQLTSKESNHEAGGLNGIEEFPLPLPLPLSSSAQTKVEIKPSPIVNKKEGEKEKSRSPPAFAQAVSPPAPKAVTPASPSFAFEETSFPSLPKKIEPVKPPQKPTFR